MRALLLAALAALAGCQLNVSGLPCNADSHCPEGQRCLLDGGAVGAADAGGRCAAAAADGGGVDAGVDGGLAPPSICLEYAKRKCAFEMRCKMDGSDRPNARIAASEEARCVATEAYERDCVVAAAGFEAGRSKLDKDKVLGVLSEIFPAADCERDLNLVLSFDFDQYIRPMTAQGKQCITDTDCIAGYCAGDATMVCGACKPHVAVGQPCSRDAMCNPATSYCPGSDGTGGSCTAYTQEGAWCDAQQEDFQIRDEVCGPDRICYVNSPGGSPACLAGRGDGAPCVKGLNQCRRSARAKFPEFVCAGSDPVTRCVKLANPAPGKSCNIGEPVGPFPTPLCRESEFCPVGLSSPSCANRKSEGQPCALSGATGIDQCQAGLRCVSGTVGRTCKPYGGPGAACASSNDCQEFLSCPSGTCQPDHALLGEGCSASVKCSEGFCDPSTGKCAPLKGEKTVCSDHAECASYVCDPASWTCASACW